MRVKRLTFRTAVAALTLAVAALVGPTVDSAAQDREVRPREQPMYGTAPRDSDVIKADEQLLQDALDGGIPRERLIEDSINRGWQTFRGGEMGLAIWQFNLAWLLDPENGNVYWGFAVVIQARDGNLERADEFMARARALMPGDARLMADSGTLMLRMGRLDDAIDLFRTAQSLQPGFGAADRGLAVAYAGKGDFKRALGHAERALERGEDLPERFMEELRARAQ